MKENGLKGASSTHCSDSGVLTITSLMNPVKNEEADETKSSASTLSQRAPKKIRNRIIISCFKCRSLRQKCDRKKPTCSRCASTKYPHCEYMEDFDQNITFQEHLDRLGLKDKRLKKKGLNDESEDSCGKLINSLPLGRNKGVAMPKDSSFQAKRKLSDNIESKASKKLRFLLPENQVDENRNNNLSRSNKLPNVQKLLGSKLYQQALEKARNPDGEQREDVSDQLNRLLIQTAMDLKKSNRNDLKSSYISILDSSKPATSAQQKEAIEKGSHPANSYFDSLFSSDTTIINKLFAKYREYGDTLEYDITTQSSITLDQILQRVFSPNLKKIWRIVGMEYVMKLDFSKYKRLQFLLKANTNFLHSWQSNNENVCEQLLDAIPSNFEDFSKIVNGFFVTNLHKCFTFLNEVKLKEKLAAIFKTDSAGNIEEIVMEEYQDQCYLGIITLMYRMMVDPEEYHHPVFDRISQIVFDFYMERYSLTHIRTQFLLLLFFKSELQFRDTYTINSKVVDSLLSWAYKIDLPKLVRDENYGEENKDILENMWYWVLYIEILAFLELGLAMRFKHNSFDETSLLTNERGRMPLLKNFIFLMRKIMTALENPFEDPDIDCIFSKVDEFCANYLAPLNYYMDIGSSNEIDHFDYIILNSFMNLKLSLFSYKFSLSESKEQKEEIKEQLLAMCLTSRNMLYVEQLGILQKVKMLLSTGTTDFSSCLKSLKKHDRLEENSQRPAWLPDFICPTFALLGGGDLYDKAVTIMETIALDGINAYFDGGRSLKDDSLFRTADDYLSLDAICADLINYSAFKAPRPASKCSPYDIMQLDRLWITKCEKDYQLIPMRISFPVIFSSTFIAKIFAAMEVLFDNSSSIKNYEDFIAAFERSNSAPGKGVSTKDANHKSTEDADPMKTDDLTRERDPFVLSPHNPVQLTPGVSTDNASSNNLLPFPELMNDIELLDFSDFIKLLN